MESQTEDLKLTPEQLSERWGGRPTVRTLCQWRYERRGPAYIKVGHAVRYPLSAVIEFERARTVTTDSAA